MNRKDVLSKLHISVPKRCLTRWTNVFDISYFILQHYETFQLLIHDQNFLSLSSMNDLNAVQSAYNVITKTCFILTLILLPLKLLSEKLEADKTTCGYIFGFEYSAFDKSL